MFRKSKTHLYYRRYVAKTLVGVSISFVSSTSDCSESTPSVSLAPSRFISSTIYTIPSAVPSSEKKRSTFYVVYDTVRRNPLYVVENLHSCDFNTTQDDDKKKSLSDLSSPGAANKRPAFHSEQLILDELYRVQTKEFNDSGYDRGHMVPAADFDSSGVLYQQTFTMANVSPQAPELNKGLWARFEAWIRHYLLKYHFQELIVITGPVFAPVFINNQWIYGSRTIGTFPRLIPVPSHFFKVIIGKNREKLGADVSVIAAFLVPNTNTVDKLTPLSGLLVKLEQLEALVGFKIAAREFSEKDRQRVDESVPDERDLAFLLSANRVIAPKDSLSLSSGSRGITHADIGNPANQFLPSPYSSKSSSTSNNSNCKYALRHLCSIPGMDCSKPMFPPKK